MTTFSPRLDRLMHLVPHVPDLAPQNAVTAAEMRDWREADQAEGLRSMAEWARLGATRYTREKIAAKLRGKG